MVLNFAIRLAIALVVAVVVMSIIGPRIRNLVLIEVLFVIIGLLTYLVIPKNYLRVRRVLHLTSNEELIQEDRGRVSHIQAILTRIINNPEVRDTSRNNLTRVSELLNEIYEAIESDSDKHRNIHDFHNHFLLLLEDMFGEFHKLWKRGIVQAKDELEETLEQLPLVVQRLEKFKEDIHESDIHILDAVNEQFKN